MEWKISLHLRVFQKEEDKMVRVGRTVEKKSLIDIYFVELFDNVYHWTYSEKSNDHHKWMLPVFPFTGVP